MPDRSQRWCSPWAWFRWCRRRSTASSRWDVGGALYKKRNEIERIFRRRKGFRRIFSRF